MTEHKQTLTNRLEDLFLTILRNVILIVLAVSIIASIGLLISGISDSGAKPEEYKYEKFDSKLLINDLKESLSDQNVKPEEKKEPTKKTSPQANSQLDDEITKQINFIVQFYKKYDFQLNVAFLNEQLKPNLRKQAKSYGFIYGEGDAAILEYAKGQTKVIELVLLDAELNKLLNKKFKAQVDLDEDQKYQVIHNYFSKIIDFYPEFHQNQINNKKAFDAEQNAESILRKQGAALKLYVAGGLFAAFLLISLILVLVKIERNLRLVKVKNDEFETINNTNHKPENIVA